MNKKVKKTPVVGVSVGDINGIGPEIILKTFKDNRIFNYCTPVVFGCKNLFNYYIKTLSLRDINYSLAKDLRKLNHKRINLFCDWQNEAGLNIEMGKPTNVSGGYAFKSLRSATRALKAGDIDVLVTAPINKDSIQSEEFNFPGHTEYLRDFFQVDENLMIMTGDDIKIAVQTGHVPLNEVSQNISAEGILKKIELFHSSLEVDFTVRKPRIAVLGLNPHAGDNGLLGKEEQEVIEPAIKKANDKGMMVQGPFPADGFYGSRLHYKYDGVLAMYHDQGLIPFKLLAFDNGINFTAGLPFVRTSPAHGTGYNIVGKNIADESSFREAVFAAIKIQNNRMLFDEITSNPLKAKIEREREEDN